MTAVLLAWSVAILFVDRLRFVVSSAPTVQAGVEAIAALTRLFGALVLFLLPESPSRRRLHWVAGGFVVLGVGAFEFGYLQPLVDGTFDHSDRETAMYASLAVWSIACTLFVIGLLPSKPPEFSRRALLVTAVVFGGASLALGAAASALPALVRPTQPAEVAPGGPILQGLTAWYWVLSAVPLGLAAAAVVGAARHSPGGALGRWLVAAMVLHAGAQLHNLFWPSAYSPELTTANLLRLAFTAVIALGAVLELRRTAAEHAALLATEQEYSKRLGDMAVLKADFTAMVAHEFGAPIATIRGFAEMLATGALRPAEQAHALATIQAETDILTTLVADVRTAAAAERDDFAIQPRPVPVEVLLADAAAFAKTLPGDHPFTVVGAMHERVRADPERIGQVLRNLLSNAAKYSAPGTPIELRAMGNGRRVRLQVADRGFGIHPHDLTRVFEKFGRGRDEHGGRIQGVGLGLYLSRRITQAHGSDLTVESMPGVGSVFGFELEIVR